MSYHTHRANHSRKAILGLDESIDFSEITSFQNLDPNVRYKCRIAYGENIENIEVVPYTLRQIKKVAVVDCDNMDYAHKYLYRGHLDNIRNKYLEYDEVIFVIDGNVTDAYYYNIVLNISGELLTPTTQLLNGVMRSYLLDEGKIKETLLTKEYLKMASEIYLINAMTDLHEISLFPDQIEYI